MDDRYYEDDEFTPREELGDNDARGDVYNDPDHEKYYADEDYQEGFSEDTPVKLIHCSSCSATFSRYPDLFEHAKIHQEERQLKFIWDNQPCSGKLVVSKFTNQELNKSSVISLIV